MSKPTIMSGKYQYSVEERGEESRYDITAPASRTGVEPRTFATMCAEDFHYKHDGWDAHWPLTFAIYSAGDRLLGRFVVDREAVPQFHASEAGPHDEYTAKLQRNYTLLEDFVREVKEILGLRGPTPDILETLRQQVANRVAPSDAAVAAARAEDAVKTLQEIRELDNDHEREFITSVYRIIGGDSRGRQDQGVATMRRFLSSFPPLDEVKDDENTSRDVTE